MTRLLLVLPLVLSAGAADAKPCRPADPAVSNAGRQSCLKQEKVVPYEPGAQRAGRQPGFIDLGSGTEIRVGGRVQMDYDTRRR
jgi:hypothetical protein